MTEENVDVGGTNRKYWLIVPEAYTGDTPMQVVFSWHGAGNDAEQATTWLGVPAVAGPSSILVYPQGTPNWTNADVAFYDAMMMELKAQYCIKEKVVTIGYSAGGTFSNFLACDRSSEMLASAVVAAGLGFQVPACDPIPSLKLHGVTDPNGAEEFAESHVKWIQKMNNCGDAPEATRPSGLPDSMTCDDYNECDAPVRICTHPGGHEWPGTEAQTVIWDFVTSLE